MISHQTRLAIRAARGSVRQVARELGVNPKTVIKWRSANMVPPPPGVSRSSAAEMRAVRFRVSSALTLDDCLYATQVALPSLTRSRLYRALRQHDVARLRDLTVFRYVSSLGLRDRLGVCSLYVTQATASTGSFVVYCAIDQATKLTLMRAYDQRPGSAEDFLRGVREVLPFPLRTILHLEGDHALLDDPAFARGLQGSGASAVRLREPALTDTATLGSIASEDRQPDISEIRSRIPVFLRTFNFSRKIKQLGGLRPAEAVARLCGEEAAASLQREFERRIRE